MLIASQQPTLNDYRSLVSQLDDVLRLSRYGDFTMLFAHGIQIAPLVQAKLGMEQILGLSENVIMQINREAAHRPVLMRR
jgi:hypothetical protein